MLRCTGAGARTYPADADGEGYTYWCTACLAPTSGHESITADRVAARRGHRDDSQPDQWPMPKGRIIKTFVYLSELGPTDGPLAVVPGSHRL